MCPLPFAPDSRVGRGFALRRGGLKAQAAVAFVKGRVGLDGTLGLGAEASIDVGVKWSKAEGFAAEALAEVKASPKFELGVNAEVTAGVDLWLKVWFG